MKIIEPEQRTARAAAIASLAVVALLAVAIARGQSPAGSPVSAPASAEPPPPWAFAVDPPPPADAPAAQDINAPHHVPGSDAAFSRKQITDLLNVPDWHPSTHPAMAPAVAHGRAPNVYACGYCHLPNGQGRPENSSLAGLPAAYIVQQMADFKSGARKGSEPRIGPTQRMIALAKGATDEEIAQAADYFSKLQPKPWIRVVETSTVPKTSVSGWMLVPLESAEMEPIGRRIIETPENVERTELRDDSASFVAYVPPGSIKQGEMLLTTGGAGPLPAPSATAQISKASATSRRSPAARPATSSANSMTCSTVPAPAPRLRS
jgi:cytochrome c553